MRFKNYNVSSMAAGYFEGKTILLVNTGSIKKKFILQELKKSGLIVVALNKEKNWAQNYVDHWILADNYNHYESLDAVKEFIVNNPTVKIDGALTFWEDDIPLLAKICREFKFIGNSVEAALNTRDKFRMQEVLRATGQPYIRQKLLKTNEDLEFAVREIGFPSIIKPVYGSDSQFVVYVNDEQEARDAYRYVLKNCTPEYDPIYKYNKKQFIYQEYIDGQEFSLECFVQHGVPHVVGIHEKTAMDLPFFVETGDYIPPRITEEQEAILVKTAEAALIVLGVRNSLAHVEIKLSKNGPKIIEVASRMGGEYIRENIVHVYNFDLIRAGCALVFGLNVALPAKAARRYIMGRVFIPRNSGVITKISGLDEIKQHPKVLNYFLSKKVGDSVLVPPDGYENMGWVLVEGDSYAELERVMAHVFEEVKIEVAPFRSYSSLGKTARKDRFSSALINKDSIIRSARITHIKNVREEESKNVHIGVACNFYDEGDDGEIEKDLTSVGKNIEKALLERGYRVTFFDFNNPYDAFHALKESDVDIVFNVCERINNSSLLEPHAAALFDILQIPYTGSNPLTLGLSIDKIRVKQLLNHNNIPTPKWDYAFSLDDRISEDLRYPLIVKPANTDNSIGITNKSVVTNQDELQKQLKEVIEDIGSPALVEEFIEGDEYDVAIMGNDEEDLKVLPLIRYIFKNLPSGYWHIYSHDAKWELDPVYKTNIINQSPPKNIGARLESLITELALETYNVLDCHDYGRVEIRVDQENNPYVLELNPNPSINIGDFLPDNYVKTAKIEYGDFLEEIIYMAIKRYKNRPPYYHLQSNLL